MGEGMGKMARILIMNAVVFLLFSAAASAGDFDWLKDFNIRAEVDPAGFRARIRARFKIGNAEIDAVLSNVEKPADAYMVFRLGEMSKRSTGDVIEKYKTGKGRGWGNLAKSLGIKPGSREFHALKRGSDLYDEPKSKGKSKNHKLVKKDFKH